MADITDEKAWELSEIMLRTTPKAGPNGSGFLSKRKAAMAADAKAPDKHYYSPDPAPIYEVAESGPGYQPESGANR